MQPPDELMVGTFLPAMRQLVARDLRSQGLSQSGIAGLLGVTQASVSLYLSSGPDRAYAALASLSLKRADADAFATLLAGDVRRGPYVAVETLDGLWRGMLGRGLVCEAHRKLYPSLSDCEFCLKRYGGKESERSDALARVAEAVRLLESSRAFASVIPEVSVNVAYSPMDSDSPEDVVAVPGRVVKARGAAMALLPPEFGASSHMARILLLVRRRLPQARACINLRYDEKVRAVLRKLRIRPIEVGGYLRTTGEDPTLAALASKLETARGPFDAVVDLGGTGVEPNLYVFARTPLEAARTAIRIAELRSAR